MYLFHGSSIKNLKVIQSSYFNSPENFEKDGIYLTDNFSIAKEYAQDNGSVYLVDVNNYRLLDLTTQELISSFFRVISEKVGIDLEQHDYFSSMIYFISQPSGKSGNGIWCLSLDVIDVLKKTSFSKKNDLRLNPDFDEFCQKVKTTIETEIRNYDLWKIKDPEHGSDGAYIYILKRDSIKVLEEL